MKKFRRCPLGLAVGLALLTVDIPFTGLLGQETGARSQGREPLRPFLGKGVGELQNNRGRSGIFGSPSLAPVGHTTRDVPTVPYLHFEAENLFLSESRAGTVSHLGVTKDGYLTHGEIRREEEASIPFGGPVSPDGTPGQIRGSFRIQQDGTLLNRLYILVDGELEPGQVIRYSRFGSSPLPGGPGGAEAHPTPLTVWYLGHCGSAVKVGSNLLVFDYLSERGTPPADPHAGGLEDGFIDPADLEGSRVFVFVTHAHSDHYDPGILDWAEVVEGIQYFFGWEAGSQPNHHYLVGPRATVAVDGLQVYTINSHHSGVPEVAYLVHVDGRWVYHNGDYRQDYIPDFEYLATLTEHLDLVFHVGLTDEKWQYTHQGYYLMEHFNPDAFLPMHFGGNEEEMALFPSVMAERGYDTPILLPGRRGDRWEIGGPLPESIRRWRRLRF